MAVIPADSVLIIEASATLRHVLNKQLRRHRYSVEALDTYADGLNRLNQVGTAATRVGSIVIGWPTHTTPTADELLALLETPRFAHLPILVMHQDADAAARAWVDRRTHTAMLEWRQNGELATALRKLYDALGALPQPLAAGVSAADASMRVLFVDDSPSVRVRYTRLLSAHGYTVDVASNIHEAFAMTQNTHYDIGIIDYFMPDGNGDELVRRLRDQPHTRNIVTAILTGTYHDKVVRDSLNAGAIDCLLKDEVVDLFLARVEAMCRTVQNMRAVEADYRRLQSILNSVGDGVYGVDQDGCITFVNPATCRILAYPPDTNLIGHSAHDSFHHADNEGLAIPAGKSVIGQAYGSQQVLRSLETLFWTQDGRGIPVECTIYPLYVRGQHEGSVIAFRDISERKSLEERLRWQSTHDPLTELFNRRYFEEQLEREHQWRKRYPGASALLYFDLDHFKYINDTSGHAIGDDLLIQVGRRLQERMRKTDTLARLGDDEFAIILRNIDPDCVQRTADEFRQLVSGQDFEYRGKTFSLTTSIGVSLFDAQAPSPGDTLVDADIACYIAKSRSGNQVHRFNPASDQKTRMDLDIGWSTQLREALEENRFELRFQPILPLALFADRLDTICPGDRLWDSFDHRSLPERISYEVLVRLRDRQGHEIMPATFIPTAERFYLMPEIDFWILDHACAELARLRRVVGQAAFSINLSGHTLCHVDLIARIRTAIETYGLDPTALTFEITETAAICDMAAALRATETIKALGCKFSLDDFGTGFGTFSHLKQLPVDFIKIDGMFVQAICHDPIDRAMVSSLTGIARHLECHTIAEYVDSPEIMRVLVECGVDFIQGYIVAAPLVDPMPPSACDPANHQHGQHAQGG
ncbi:MAG: EAL domain-containing protein [Gammaproteobacteria bacterium]